MLVAHKYIYRTKCIWSPFIGDMRTNHPITQSQASVVSCADHFNSIQLQHVNKHETVFHNLLFDWLAHSTKLDGVGCN